jgi:hypothetical protein
MREGVVSAGYVRADGATLTTTSMMDDTTKAMLTDVEYNASSSSANVTVRVALWTYDMSVDGSSQERPSDPAAIANSSAAAVAADGTPYITRKTLPDSWNAVNTPAISAAACDLWAHFDRDCL